MANLIEGIQAQQARCRELLEQYKAIGPAGAFGHAMISADIAAADRAIASGDVIAMLAAFKRLEGCK